AIQALMPVGPESDEVSNTEVEIPQGFRGFLDFVSSQSRPHVFQDLDQELGVQKPLETDKASRQGLIILLNETRRECRLVTVHEFRILAHGRNRGVFVTRDHLGINQSASVIPALSLAVL